MAIDVEKICRDACDGVPLSLRDDPTTWSDEPTMQDVRDAVEQAAHDNMTSALAKAFGAAVEPMATDMDAAIVEDGPLADLDAIWDSCVSGLDRVDTPDFSNVVEATEWEGRVEALRDELRLFTARSVLAFTASVPDLINRLAANVLIADSRVAHLKDEPFTPPAFLKLDPTDAVEEVVWDDEPTDTELETQAASTFDWDDEPAPTRRRRSPPPNGQMPKLCGLLEAAGFQDKDAVRVLGVKKAYYSLMKSGKRHWQGLRDQHVADLRTELLGRQDAIAQALASLEDPAVRNPTLT